ncbi:hypothetical protein P389DRAFT_40726 [Cystobasidium minutum MCA 4210]|uniref:uncharacterized protein n=1 Tax=Cystobasidium minutum MCA 4210 TaxID=1397322 RepID=UPI0034CE11F5|eukprot:jgi/Rhomi1/40726/CE40725_199
MDNPNPMIFLERPPSPIHSARWGFPEPLSRSEISVLPTSSNTSEQATTSEISDQGDTLSSSQLVARSSTSGQTAASSTSGHAASSDTSYTHVQTRSKTLVLCFDGTTNMYEEYCTNVAKLFQYLDKTDDTKQMCYYQPGIGSYTLPSIVTPITTYVSKVIDMGVAWFFATHVTGGYRFLMDNYEPGDKICLFGFSRGAYTARALAGMIHRVGLISSHNYEQVEFAWQLYCATGKNSWKPAAHFKKHMSRDVKIDFVGVWDTVSSVGGFFDRSYRFTANNRSIKVFRQALSLDERRAKFLQNRFKPEYKSKITDVLQVYFAGDHSDVGGGNASYERPLQLSNIPLRWMLCQIEKAGIPVHFNEACADFIANYDAAANEAYIELCKNTVEDFRTDKIRKPREYRGLQEVSLSALNANILPDIGDCLSIGKGHKWPVVGLWWILELMPFRRRYKQEAKKGQNGIEQVCDREAESNGRNKTTHTTNVEQTEDSNEQPTQLSPVADDERSRSSHGKMVSRNGMQAEQNGSDTRNKDKADSNANTNKESKTKASEDKWKSHFVPHFGQARQLPEGAFIHESVRQKMELSTGIPYTPRPKIPESCVYVGM